MFEETLVRLSPMPGALPPLVVTGAAHLGLVREAAAKAGVDPELMIVEPDGRNTAPAAIAAALWSSPEEVLVILPSDHLIGDYEVFRSRVAHAAEVAASGYIVTFGVIPDRPETGYGYIEQGDPVNGGFQVRRFKEKPEADEARALSTDGRHLWNSGIFVVPAGLLIEEAARHVPEVLAGVETAFTEPSQGTLSLGKSFAEVEKISLDHAIMEKTTRALVVPIDVGWDDVGSFQALWALSDKDGQENAVSGDVLISDVSGSLIIAGSRRVAVAGVDDLVVIETPDAVLVLPRDRSQDVKTLIENADPGPMESEDPAPR